MGCKPRVLLLLGSKVGGPSVLKAHSLLVNLKLRTKIESMGRENNNKQVAQMASY